MRCAFIVWACRKGPDCKKIMFSVEKEKEKNAVVF